MSETKIQSFIDNLQESIEIEVKNWLNGLSNNTDKAKLAKEIIALANNGGGYIFIGFRDENGEFPEIEPEDGEFEAFTQDNISSLVHRFVHPPCECQVKIFKQMGSEIEHPVITVSGDHRTPLWAARGNDGGGLLNDKIYIRRPGANSEEPRTQDDWEKLIDRLVKARQSDLLEAIRGVLEPSSNILSDEDSTLDDWYSESYSLWKQIINGFDEDDPRRLSNGHWAISFSISDFHADSLNELNSTLQNKISKYSGWPPFTYMNSVHMRPRLVDQTICAYIGALGAGENPEDKVDYCDYWRVSKSGNGFLLRPMQEDEPAYGSNTSPPPNKPLFDWLLPIYRLSEVCKFIESIAKNHSNENSKFQLQVCYYGTKGRKLSYFGHKYFLHGSGTCFSEKIENKIEANVGDISINLEELVLSILHPIYEQFEFSELPRELVNNVVKDVLSFR